MAGITTDIANQITRIGRHARTDIRQRTIEDHSKVLLRRLQGGYDKLSIEQISALQAGLGHQDTEERPCKACKIIAQKEFELAID